MGHGWGSESPKYSVQLDCLGGWHQFGPGVLPHDSVGLGLRHRTSEAVVCASASQMGAE